MEKTLYRSLMFVGLVVVIAFLVVIFVRGDVVHLNSKSDVVPEQVTVSDNGREVSVEGTADVTTEVIENEGEPVDWADPSWQTINRYYGELSYDLEKAYAMRADQSVSFKTFQSWYDHVKFAWTRDPVDLGNNTYRFFVNLVEEDPFDFSFYQVVTKVVGDKLQTILAREVEQVVLGTIERPGHKGDGAQIYYDDGVEYVYRDDNGKRTTVTKINRNRSSEFGGGNLFMETQKIAFSESGDYLMISYSGWENGSLEVYNFEDNKKVHEVGSPYTYAFGNDESWFAECQGSGMSSGYVRVYDAPSWNLRYEHPEGGAFGDCSINVENHSIDFSTVIYNAQGTGEETRWRYDVASDTTTDLSRE